MNNLLCLVMILKDEARTIESTLLSVKNHLDHYLILDTGSTDGTRDIVLRTLAGIQGELRQATFVDFATTRNLAIDLAELTWPEARFFLFLDADDKLEGGRALEAFLKVEKVPDTYNLRVQIGATAFDSPRIMRNGCGWRYAGRTHEVLVHPNRPPPTIRIPGVTIRRAPGVCSTSRWKRDLEILAESPDDARSVFYLAKTHHWLGQWDQAEAAFQKRIAMGGWEEEIYESSMAIAAISDEQKKNWQEAQGRYLAAYAVAPHRAEPLHAIARHYEAENHAPLCFLFARRGFELPEPDVRLFLDKDVYEWRLADLVAVSAWYVGEYKIGEEAAKIAVAARPNDERLVQNLALYTNRT